MKRFSNFYRADSVRRIGAILLIMLLLGALPWARSAIASEQKDLAASLLTIAGGALVDAGKHNWTDVKAELERFSELWGKLQPEQTDLTRSITDALKTAHEAIEKAGQQPDEAYEALSALTKLTDQYVSAAAGKTEQPDGKEQGAKLLPLFKQSLAKLQDGSLEAAQKSFRQVIAAWPRLEKAIRQDNRTVYGKLETAMSLTRIALQAEPPRIEQAEQELNVIIQLVEDYSSGKLNKADEATEADRHITVAEMLLLLEEAQTQISALNAAAAYDKVQQFILLWPSIETQVSTRSKSAYQRVENKMIELSGFLVSQPPDFEKASKGVGDLHSELEPYKETEIFSMWDAVIILLREGMEALLVLTALLAFLNRTGHADKRKWVWSGVGTGLLLSGLMAVVLTYYISQAIAGTSRELVEGLTGLMAAVFMLAVGIWLHGKSNARTWNAYMNRQAGGALAKGSLWSLFILSGLAVLREGAETVVIYVGMAASIPMSELLLGILIAFAILAVAGFLIIRFSVRLPLRPFFLAAVVLMNYLVFRFAGESLHSLQVAGYISAHPSDKLLMVEWAGIYPTWETTLTQAVLLIYLVIQFCWAELRRS